MRKFILPVGLILILIVLTLAGYLFFRKDIPFFQTVSSPPPVTGTVNGVEKAKLVSIARSYIQTNPRVHLENQFISWEEAVKIVNSLDINYFSKHNPNNVDLGKESSSVNMVEPYKSRQEWWNKEAIDKFVVQWDPGCDDYIIQLQSEGREEFISKCLSDFRFFVLVDKDLKPVLIDILNFSNRKISLKEVAVTTDKTEYRRGKIIKITIRNGLDESSFSHAGSATPVFAISHLEKKVADGDWETLSVRAKGGMYDIDAPREIKPGQSEAFEWEPWIYKDDKGEPVQAGAGVYRLLITYQIKKSTSSENWEWLQVYSNEFTID